MGVGGASPPPQMSSLCGRKKLGAGCAGLGVQPEGAKSRAWGCSGLLLCPSWRDGEPEPGTLSSHWPARPPCNRAHTLVVMGFLHLKVCGAENSHFMSDSKLPPPRSQSSLALWGPEARRELGLLLHPFPSTLWSKGREVLPLRCLLSISGSGSRPHP